MALEPPAPPFVALRCPAADCGGPLDFAARRNGGTPVRETCPSSGTHLTRQAGRLRATVGEQGS